MKLFGVWYRVVKSKLFGMWCRVVKSKFFGMWYRVVKSDSFGMWYQVVKYKLFGMWYHIVDSKSFGVWHRVVKRKFINCFELHDGASTVRKKLVFVLDGILSVWWSSISSYSGNHSPQKKKKKSFGVVKCNVLLNVAVNGYTWSSMIMKYGSHEKVRKCLNIKPEVKHRARKMWIQSNRREGLKYHSRNSCNIERMRMWCRNQDDFHHNTVNKYRVARCNMNCSF